MVDISYVFTYLYIVWFFHLVLLSVDKTVKLWDVSSGQTLKTLQGHRAAVLSIAFSPDSQTIASGSEDCLIFLPLSKHLEEIKIKRILSIIQDTLYVSLERK
ncbi:MAG: WD40 repeat domain-containing protein [Nostoc sp. DedQUE01]|nr:hypothetical protein [Nostoc sp. DedQUE11]MDZ8076438.1 hypothetical protein [Nostoc sp. DedQUE01]